MIAVKELSPGLIISDAVITPSGKTLLNPGGVLTERAISLLSMWDVNYVYINSEDDHEPLPEEDAQPQSSSFNISAECMQFFQEYNSILTSTANSFAFVRDQSKVPILALKSTSFAVYSSILTTGPALMDYLLISDYQLADKIVRHTVMVAYICGLIGKQLHYNESELKALTLAGLLHDIGKMVISNENKPSTEMSHVIDGAQLIKNVKGISDEVTLSVLQHHEYLDGTGFPMGIPSRKIHPYAKIIAIADVFHYHSYGDAYCNPFTALNVLTKEMFGKLDPSICQMFTKQVRDSLVNSNVILSDGQEATIIFFPPSNSNDPIVRTLDQKLIDLSTDKTRTITRICTPDYPIQ
ncbi:MAG: metal dependent phosphohydrolase [Pelosinus sp.]|jgi:putative nucleotidyltransferase with HDIG domain|nr:metal dependent phosphohydrolase [Pelosinus sp.]